MLNEPMQYEDEPLLPGEEDQEGPAVEQKMVAVQGQDGQQYVVLEVIQLQVGKAGGGVHGMRLDCRQERCRRDRRMWVTHVVNCSS